ncbi:DUF1641 domain-containing protein [Altererythrobacter sp. FM1]|uniref:DUF1641 domain-containing protein n=1 Tax=Tsuneonella flava TaxID=2055955 RepID=A0ABX7KAS1_9SPHN|nr:DUF1641 domain-containing protein [Tsuneonella flava]QSB44407.1 DUF1641 domain-containing protein [Tsuneonella flava]ROT94063.1 DUF1641 domain-containing protein [Altererythrobacter sp. FM1]
MANPTNTAAGGPLIERLNQESAFADKATEAGLIDLANKVAPLIQGRRFHNVVDLLSLVADGVDMADDAMIQKMMSGYEDLVSNAWMLSNAVRYATNEAGQQPVPSRMGLLRAAGDEDVRRGLHFMIQFLAVLGRQTAHGAVED